MGNYYSDFEHILKKKMELFSPPAATAQDSSHHYVCASAIDGRVQLLQLPDQQELADIQLRTQQTKSLQQLLLQRAD